jgi:acetyl-CoA acetyltransferase
MSNFPLTLETFEAGRRLTTRDESEGGPPLVTLLNEAAQPASSTAVLAGNVDYSAASEAAVKAAGSAAVTNTGAARQVTLPDFASAPDGWTQTYIALDASGLTVAVAGADTINSVAGDVVLAAAHDWCVILKAPGAATWLSQSCGATGVIAPT